MKNIVIEQKQEKKNKYIPAIAFLLAAPVGVASAFLTSGTIENFASLNESIMSNLVPEASAGYRSCNNNPQGGVSFSNSGKWIKSGAAVRVTDCDCQCWYDCADDDGDDDDGA